MVIAYLGLGANLGDREGNLVAALDHLRATGKVEVLAISSFRETMPIAGPSQPPYLNAVARIRTELEPDELLDLLKAAERAAGRKPTGVRWGPREADLDLLYYGDRVVETEALTVPHPRMKVRAFVLEPLAELAPDLRDPVTGRTVKAMLRSLIRKRSGQRTSRLIRKIPELRKYAEMTRRNRFTVGLVPTMGALHEGHLSLIRAARRTCDKVIVSIFVNPTQFGEGEDLDAYPRQLREDVKVATEVDADVVFAPSSEAMYPEGFATWVTVEGLTEKFCGASRPTHFRGVTTVVTKLLNLAKPDVAFFGQKDYQQAVVIRRMVRDLSMDAKIEVLPTVREEDGLALSSRNQYLDAEGRRHAPCLRSGLLAARTAYEAGERLAESLIARIRDVIEAEGGAVEPEYVAVVDPETLEPLREVSGGAAILVAARVGEVRLIDNILLGVTP